MTAKLPARPKDVEGLPKPEVLTEKKANDLKAALERFSCRGERAEIVN